VSGTPPLLIITTKRGHEMIKHDQVTITDENITTLTDSHKVVIRTTETTNLIFGIDEDDFLEKWSDTHRSWEKRLATIDDKKVILGKVIYLAPAVNFADAVNLNVPLGVM
jgi:hypothetical protein